MPNYCYPTRVPFEGSKDDCKLFIVGEAPGGQEVGQGRPFVGEAGQLLRRYLQRQGIEIDPKHVRFGNLSKHRPRPDNKFRRLLNTPELEQGLKELQAELQEIKPNLILALGNWPLWFITGECGLKNNKPVPGTGIGLYRGSLLPAKPEYGGGKVLAAYHPSFVNRRGNAKYRPILAWDLQRAAGDMEFPELAYPEYEEWIDPPRDQCQMLLEESLNAEWLGVDIETFPGGKFSCIGWAFRRAETNKLAGVCITYKNELLWPFAQQMWESDAPKIFQYGTYDVSFMKFFWDWNVGGYYDGVGHDTYVASGNLLPDYPRGLDFLCSIHTRLPYYKTERKVWREQGDMNILWRYNIKDTVGTLLIAEEQIRLLGELYGVRFA